MSAYIVNNETLSVIVDAFMTYDVDFDADDYRAPTPRGCLVDRMEKRLAIGQSLLNANYKSVNYRYGENTPPARFIYKPVRIDPGIVFGCVRCFMYQACEPDDWEDSKLAWSLRCLQTELLRKLLDECGYEKPWGVPSCGQ